MIYSVGELSQGIKSRAVEAALILEEKKNWRLDGGFRVMA